MKTFLAVFTGTPASMTRWSNLSGAERKERETAGIAAWHAWAERHKTSVADMGAPLGKTKSVSPAGIADIHNNLTAYALVRAESHEAAARLFEQHPHFTIFPGDAIEVMECLPIPEG